MFHKCKSCIRISFQIHRYQSFKMSQLESLKFDNLVLRKLPIDHIKENYVRTVAGACFSKISPTPVERPALVAFSASALSLLDITLDETNSEEFVQYFSGNKTLPGSETAAHCYCGHQFGVFAGQLGDGAAIYLGEVINSKDERWEIQLKGAGRTPFSRTADGRKVLRSSIREFLCSEAMHALGIPTSRAGSCISSYTYAPRDMFYKGNVANEKCSIVLRIAPTFLRFGSFEIFTPLNRETGKFGPSVGRLDILIRMLDYVIETFYPEIHGRDITQDEKYAEFYKEVVLRTARLVAQWQCVGFCHGVLNTDNMSILGLTIDYGPFGFLDVYNPDHICNQSDLAGRYSFNAQPAVCKWNLRKFAEAIQQAVPLSTCAEILTLYDEEFKKTFLDKMRSKLGLIAKALPEDKNLIDELFDTMEKTGADFTNTFLCLMIWDFSNEQNIQKTFNNVKELVLTHCYSRETLIRYYEPEFQPGQLQIFKQVTLEHPEIVSQPGPEGMAIRKVMMKLRKAEQLRRLETDHRKKVQDRDLWSIWLKRYRKRIEEDLKDYQGDAKAYDLERRKVMCSNNPRFVLRNYIAQEAIKKAENSDYTCVQELLKRLQDPYQHDYNEPVYRICPVTISQMQMQKRLEPSVEPTVMVPNPYLVFDWPPESAFSIKISCSS